MASVCSLLPTPSAPYRGIFVQRRLDALARVADVLALQPSFWFPILRPAGDLNGPIGTGFLRARRQRAFYLPGLLKRFDGRWLQRAVEPVLRDWHREFRLDLLDAHFGFPEGVGCALVARRFDLPLFITVRGNETDYLRMPGIAPRLRLALRQCAGVVAVSHSLRDLLVRHGIDANKIAVIPNGIDHTLFYPGASDAARAAVGLPLDRRYLVSIGQISRNKGHDCLIRAFHVLRHRHPDLELVLIGREGRSLLRNLAQQLGLEHAVRFVGPQRPDRVGAWLRAADLFVLPSHREGCCNAVLEALACGTPVITTPVGDNERYIEPGETGLIVPVDQENELAEALHWALEHRWDRAAIAACMADQDWNMVARSVLEFFGSSLGRTSSR